MSKLDLLVREDIWQDFYQKKLEKHQLRKDEILELDIFLAEKRYLKIIESMEFSYPIKKEIAKMGSEKKRVVYSYGKDETWVLKLLAYLLYDYDTEISDSCYSFRKEKTAKTAIDRLKQIKNLDDKYVIKADIHNYFNSIPVERLIEVLKDIIRDDPKLLDFLCSLLRQNKCIYHGKLIEEERGAMAGVPLASFFANIYLLSMDRFFEKKKIPYFRYSDDILIICDNKEQSDECYQWLLNRIEENGLTINLDKMHISLPQEGFEFLGLQINGTKFDLSMGTLFKMKGKIKRKTKSIKRKIDKNHLSFERAAVSLIRYFDYRFYDLSGEDIYTWTGWYFPVITQSEGLRVIDRYLVQNLRYLATGRYYKGNYRVLYEDLKKLGYTSLVHEYYTWKKVERKLKANG